MSVHDERNVPWNDGSANSVRLSNDEIELTRREK